jgi:polysaccharide chain length determinant protein (PEP-CTERM system associated)
VQDIVSRLHAELRSVWRYRWPALGVAWAVCTLGWLAVYLTPNTYEAQAKFYLDTSSALAPFVKDLSVGMDVDQQVDLVKQVVLGRETLLNVAREADIDLSTATPVEVEAKLESLKASIQLTGGAPARWNPRERDRNFSIAYRDTDRQRAVKVVQGVLDSFIEGTLKKRSSGFQSAQDFLQRQILEQEQRLAEAEDRLAEFKRRNIDNLPTQEGSYVQSLQTEMAALQDLRSQQRMLAGRRQQLSAQLAAERQYIPSSELPAGQGGNQQAAGGSELDAAILQAQTRLDQLLRSYTPKHPEVIALEQDLVQLRAKRREELERLGVSDMPERGGLVANPAYEQIRLQRNQVDVELAAVGGQIADRSARISNMRSKMSTMPEVEAELSQLTRDYDVLKARYGELLEQLETAKLSESVGETDQVVFSIVDPPAALANPVAPPRLLLLIGAFFAGLGAGAAVAFALSKLNPVFDSLTVLRNLTGLPVLGAVSATWLERRKQRRRLEVIRVAAVGAVLVVVFVGVVLARDAGTRLLAGVTG